MADENGNIYDAPRLLMVCRRGAQWGLPRPDELMPLPEESELFLLPGRLAVGLDPETGLVECLPQLAVAAFAAPGHTFSAHPAYKRAEDAPLLPLFAYGAVGFYRGRFYVCARRVDEDPRQQFCHIPRARIEQNARRLLREHPKNRLIRHILNNCVLRYDCPAARNFALGRFEAPLPSSRACNARCVGCISAQDKDSPVAVTPQHRLAFTPTPEEIVGVMRLHESRETRQPVYSFGQGCEGDPLTNTDLLVESVRLFRKAGGRGTVNCNTNASKPEAVARLAQAGLTSLRVSCNSAREDVYNRYYRPADYTLSDVRASMKTARAHGVFIALNLLFFPGVTDTEEELEALAAMIGENGVSMVQWRNLNIDPEWYFALLHDGGTAGDAALPSMGLALFMKRLKKLCPWLRYGYFNPWLGDRADIAAPAPGEWSMPL
ncbi:MAG: radical SAM protein [Desulfovibrio sp.]|jgi:pyruvate-formate lyase-activating enzyme|nr:radical SAM protein [Desulfovibrio sp.]